MSDMDGEMWTLHVRTSLGPGHTLHAFLGVCLTYDCDKLVFENADIISFLRWHAA